MQIPRNTSEASEVYSSEDALESYVEHAKKGLFPTEANLVDRYFRPCSARVLDVGCGTGRTTKPLTDKGYDVVGVDISPGMITTAKDEHPGVEFYVGDATALPFSSDSFEFALFPGLNIDIFHPRSKRLTALREVRRVLKPGGILIISAGNSLYLLGSLFRRKIELFFRFYVRNGNYKRLFKSYKRDHQEWGLDRHFSTPLRHVHEFRKCGFSIEKIGKREFPARYVEKDMYYVLRKSGERK
ncbi:class I SAM-dependent methyltransferase [Natronocalculus amylovorans]|uniref:Class I SAM-dependent methyltransferase n=1 Tax=Natronocalculus amylovorans TaxID=2917812 RepID=A0AAE3K9F1_9EURY|nr:class I SAM-dependent methyltransferase [Natronocalculus amylovorans]MCL9818292.1 class I SAM-dependent methyltransferase [Natronocalculus amylovorans]